VIQVTAQMRILVAIEPVDFRAGIDGLARVCRERLAADPFTGVVVVFRNRRATTIRLLSYDGQGFWLATKRLSSGRFRWWPSAAGDGAATQLAAHQLQVLLWSGNPTAAQVAPAWRQINVAQ
jgi:transposase